MSGILFAFIDEPPFVSPSSGGGWPVGCDAELAALTLARMGVRDASAVGVSFADLLPGVVAGRWTVNTPLFVTEDRARQVRFSRPVWALADGLMVRAADEERFATYEAIAASPELRLGVVAGQVQAVTAQQAGIPDDRIMEFAEPEAVVVALKEGRVDAYASVAFAHRGFLARAVTSDLTVSDLGLPQHAGCAGSTPAYGAFSFATSNTFFADAFDAALAGVLGSTEHEAIMARYGFTVRDGLGRG